MKPLTLAAGSIEDRTFDSLAQKLEKALELIEFAGASGADLLVLPELLNAHKPLGVPGGIGVEELIDIPWHKQIGPVLDRARKLKLALAVAVLYEEGGVPRNGFFLVESDGSIAGRYHKRQLPPPEAAKGVKPDVTPLIPWRGLKVGGAICFDVYYPDVFQSQADAGADLFLVPSLTPGGAYLNHYALHHGAEIVLAYPGMSRIIDALGREIGAAGFNHETLRFGFAPPLALATVNFNRVSLFGDINQPRIREILLRYGRRVRVHFDQPSVTFLLESIDPQLDVEAIVREYGLVPRREYFARSRTLAPTMTPCVSSPCR